MPSETDESIGLSPFEIGRRLVERSQTVSVAARFPMIGSEPETKWIQARFAVGANAEDPDVYSVEYGFRVSDSDEPDSGDEVANAECEILVRTKKSSTIDDPVVLVHAIWPVAREILVGEFAHVGMYSVPLPYLLADDDIVEVDPKESEDVTE